MTEQDKAWIKKKIRDSFDTPKEVHQFDEYFQLIEMAERIGFYELVEEMKSDLPFTKTHNPYQ